MNEKTKRTVIVVIGFVGYYLGAGLFRLSASPGLIFIGIILWLVGMAFIFWGFYIWIRLKQRDPFFIILALLTWVGLIVIACLKDKSKSSATTM
jgi:uncharacterized membrane protein